MLYCFNGLEDPLSSNTGEQRTKKNPEAVEEKSKIVFVLYRTKPLKLQVYTLTGTTDNS